MRREPKPGSPLANTRAASGGGAERDDVCHRAFEGKEPDGLAAPEPVGVRPFFLERAAVGMLGLRSNPRAHARLALGDELAGLGRSRLEGFPERGEEPRDPSWPWHLYFLALPR